MLDALNLDALGDYPLLRSFLTYVAAIACAIALMELATRLWRWWKGTTPPQPRDWHAFLDSMIFMLWFAALIAVMDQRDWSWWMTLIALAIVTGLMAVASIRISRRRIESIQRNARDNPGIPNAAHAPEPPPVPIDWTSERRMAMILLPALGIYIGGIFAILWGGKAFGYSGPACAGATLLWMLLPPALLALGRYPGRLRQRHTLVINAAPQQVWDTLHCRETDAYYRSPCARIEKVAGTSNRYIWHYADIGPCFTCGLPKGRDQAKWHLLVEVTAERPGHSARQIATFPDSTPSICRLYASEVNAFRIEPHPDGAEVTYEIEAKGVKLWMLCVMAAGNVARDLLGDLKSHLEGTKGEGVFANGRRHTERAAASPKLCGCPAT